MSIGAIADPARGTTVEAQARATVASLIDGLQAKGLLARFTAKAASK